jgi:sigma-B regulation protein RsbU (phosphoserine phosphatase)
MMRTLVDEGFDGPALVARLNTQIAKHAPGSRFITLFVATLDPVTGHLVYVNAGQNPPLVRRAAGGYERLREGGIALGMFDHASYTAGETSLATGDLLVMYSDGVTEAENDAGQPFDERGLEAVIDACCRGSAKELGWAAFAAVERHTVEKRLVDDLTVLVTRKLPPLPAGAVAETAAVSV